MQRITCDQKPNQGYMSRSRNFAVTTLIAGGASRADRGLITGVAGSSRAWRAHHGLIEGAESRRWPSQSSTASDCRRTWSLA